MASNLHFSIARINASLDAYLDVLNGGTIKIYSGAQPANPDASLGAAVLLATLTLSATAFSAASGGVKTANAITAGSAVATGTAAFFRAFTSGAVAVVDGSVGTSGCDLNIPSTTIQQNAQVSASSCVFTQTQ